jgi:predicted amidohydrolase YtcJ
METVGGAYASFQEHRKGSIEAGKLADMVLLSGEPGDKAAEVVMTMMGGRVVWER